MNGQTGSDRGERDAPGAGPEREAIAREVFDLAPFGVVVLDRDGIVVGANPAAGRLLGSSLAAPASQPVRCCALFGCRQAGGPLEGGCLTELAIERGGELPEVRIDVTSGTSGGSVDAVWVAASAVGEARLGRVVVQLRAGDSRDRRRRTSPHWITGPRLEVSVLGPTRVASGEGPIGGKWLEQRPGQLLKYLVCERHRVVPTEEIAEAIWPRGDARALGNVRHFIHGLRGRLEPQRPKRSPSAFIVARQGGYTINRRLVHIDADEFEERVTTGVAASAAGEALRAREELERAVHLYRGELLAEEPYAEWAFGERERLREIAGRALGELTELKLRAGELDGAITNFQRLANMHPFDTHVQQELIELYLRRGRRSEAVRHYSALRMRMLREFGSPPEFELSELGDELPGRRSA
jgi:DNA-binding SARP family transcriptional activator